jgi:hypothetical protein
MLVKRPNSTWYVLSTQWKSCSKIGARKAVGCECRRCIYRVLFGEVRICTQGSGPMSVLLTASTKNVNTPEYTQMTLCQGAVSDSSSMTVAKARKGSFTQHQRDQRRLLELQCNDQLLLRLDDVHLSYLSSAPARTGMSATEDHALVRINTHMWICSPSKP